MHYRTFGQMGFDVSALGFGLMRLPLLDEQSKQVDEDRAVAMIRRAIELGVNYLDTAWVYHDGASERALGKALTGELRAKVRIATKLPTWEIKSRDDLDRYLDAQLERLGTNIDVYLVHCLSGTFWDSLRRLGLLEWAEQAMARGRFGRFGFSFHDHYPAFERIVNEYDGWSLAQIQYNFMDQENQAGRRGLELAAQRGLAVSIMEPLRGGALATAPEAVERLWATSGQQRSAAEWGLRWLWDQPQVGVVLSGMSTMEQLEENVASAGRAAPGCLSQADQELVAQVAAAYRELYPVHCTGCRYCLPCPNGVEIPRILKLFNEASQYRDLGVVRYFYKKLDERERADRCERCGKCEERCPQKLPIMDTLAAAHEKLKG